VSTPDIGAAATPTACTSNTPCACGIRPIDGEVLQYGVILIIDESSLDGLGRAPRRYEKRPDYEPFDSSSRFHDRVRM
jgi:hypothetical protein